MRRAQDLVVEAVEAALVCGDHARRKCALPIARDVDGQRPVVGQHGLRAGAIAVIGRVVGLDAPARVAEVMGQLAA